MSLSGRRPGGLGSIRSGVVASPAPPRRWSQFWSHSSTSTDVRAGQGWSVRRAGNRCRAWAPNHQRPPRLPSVPYHVRITPRDRRRRHRDALALDKDADWIEEHVTAPRRQGRDIFVDGQVFSWDDIDEIHITETDH